MTVSCTKPGCQVCWPRDPVLEVACPDCKAPVGVPCRRPSGHKAWGSGGFDFHRSRDLLADRQGHYGVCPTGRCGLNQSLSEQADLFRGAA